MKRILKSRKLVCKSKKWRRSGSSPPLSPSLTLSVAHLSIEPSSLIIWGPLGPIVKNKSLGPLDVPFKARQMERQALSSPSICKANKGGMKKSKEGGRSSKNMGALNEDEEKEANEKKRGNGRRTKSQREI